MIASFTFSLNCQILPGVVTVGKFDGVHPSLACGTTSGKVVIHSPHDSQGEATSGDKNGNIRFLNINNKITCLGSGPLHPDTAPREMLLVGTATNLLVYDTEKNSDVFYKEIPDGVECMTLDRSMPEVLVCPIAVG